jgi:hypothetical protein
MPEKANPNGYLNKIASKISIQKSDESGFRPESSLSGVSRGASSVGGGTKAGSTSNSVSRDRAERLLELFQTIAKQRKPIALLRVVL